MSQEGLLKKRILAASERTLEAQEWVPWVPRAKNNPSNEKIRAFIKKEIEEVGSLNIDLSVPLDDLNKIIDEAKQNFPEYDGSAEDFYVKVMGWKEEYLGK